MAPKTKPTKNVAKFELAYCALRLSSVKAYLWMAKASTFFSWTRSWKFMHRLIVQRTFLNHPTWWNGNHAQRVLDISSCWESQSVSSGKLLLLALFIAMGRIASFTVVQDAESILLHCLSIDYGASCSGTALELSLGLCCSSRLAPSLWITASKQDLSSFLRTSDVYFDSFSIHTRRLPWYCAYLVILLTISTRYFLQQADLLLTRNESMPDLW